MTLSIYPSAQAPLMTLSSAEWLQAIGLSSRTQKLGAVLNSELTGSHYWRKQNNFGYTSEKPPMNVEFMGTSLATGYLNIIDGLVYKQGYMIQYVPPISSIEQALSTSKLAINKHYMLCLTIDLSKDNTSVGKIVDSNYSSVTNQLGFEFVEYNPAAPTIWDEAPYQRALADIGVTGKGVVMLADINTAAALGSTPEITMLRMSYEALKATKREGKQLVARFASNQSVYPEKGQTGLYGNNYNQTTVIVAKTPVLADDVPNRTYTIGSNNTDPNSAHYGTQRVPFLYSSYPQQPYSAGSIGFAYDPAKPWTGGLNGRKDGTQNNEYIEMTNEATFKCNTAGVYKFDVSVMLFGAVAPNPNTRYHGLAMYIERTVNTTPSGMRTRIDGVQEIIRDDNYNNGTSGSRAQGFGVGQTPRQTLTQEFTVTLYEGDTVFMILYTDRSDITTVPNGTTRARFEQENLDIWYMGEPTDGNRTFRKIDPIKFEAGFINVDGSPAVPSTGAAAIYKEVRTSAFIPITGGSFTYNYAVALPNNVNGAWSAVAFYDASGAFISRPAVDEGAQSEAGVYVFSYDVPVPAGATQVKLTCRGYEGGGLMSIGDLIEKDDLVTKL